jgi:hypothetical protein
VNFLQKQVNTGEFLIAQVNFERITHMITETTKIIKVHQEGIPEFLKALPYWINWKPVFMDGKAKKLPTYGETALRLLSATPEKDGTGIITGKRLDEKR